MKVTREWLSRWENFETYAENYLWITDKHNRVVPFRLKECQRRVVLAIMRCLARGLPPRIVILKARQMGFSTLIQGILFWLAHLQSNYGSLVIAHKKESTSALFDKSRMFYERLNRDVRPPKRFLGKKELELTTGSRIAVEVATKGGGRGITANGLHLSEFAYMISAAELLQAASQSVPKTPLSLIAIESTPNGFNLFRDIYLDAKNGRSDFEAVFVPWFEEPEYRMSPGVDTETLDKRERELVDRFGVDAEQLAWRRYVIRTELRDAEKFEVEYPSDDVSCFLQTGRPVFEAESIGYYQGLVPPARDAALLPERQDIELDVTDPESPKPKFIADPSGPLRIYTPEGKPYPRHLYIVGFDPSEGDRGSDPSPVVVLDRNTLEVAAVWSGRLRPDKLARIAAALALYFGGALVIWEANNHGLTAQVEIEKWYHHVYYREVSADSVAKRITDKPGYDAKVKTKSFGVNTLRRYINDRLAPIYAPEIVNEIPYYWYIQPPGVENADRARPDHLPGHTADHLTALWLCLVAHRGSEESELAPLSEEDLATAVAEVYRIEQMAAMGLVDAKVEREQLMSRFHATADDLEAIDEARAHSRERDETSGLGRSV